MHPSRRISNAVDHPSQNQRLRVAFAIGSLGGGGSERQLVQLLREIDRQQFEPLLYLLHRSGPLLNEIPTDIPIFSFSDQHSHPRRIFPGRIHRMHVRHLTDFLRTQQIQVVYDRTWISTLVAGPATLQAGIPRISVIVADPRRDLEHGGGRYAGHKKRLLFRAYHRASRVVAVSHNLRRATIDYYRLPPDRVVTVWNPIDVARIDRLAAAHDPPLEAGRFHIVSAGRLQEQKGYRYLIDAVGNLVQERGHNQIMLHILGTGSQEPELRNQVAERELTNFVRFEGFQENPFGFYRKAHLFCLASIYEGMPNALLEAMACQTPVVAADCPTGPREILQDGRFGRLVPTADATALADAIENAIADYDRSSSVCRAARLHVETEFSPGANVQDIQNLLLDVHREPKTR